MKPLTLMGIGFVMGLAVDMFYDSVGLHAFACILIMYVRNYWLNNLTPQGGYDSGDSPSLSLHGIHGYSLCSALVSLSLRLFFIEAGGFHVRFTLENYYKPLLH